MNQPTPPHDETDFDGCNRECRKAGAHTLNWGRCEHATPPEPTVSMSKVDRDADGYNSIGFDVYTVPELGELITAGLRASDLPVNGDDLVDVGVVAAHAIVHRNDELASSVVSSPAVPADETWPSRRAGLRAELAAALVRYDWNAGLSGRDTPSEHHYGEVDAVLAVLYREWPWLRAEAEDTDQAATIASCPGYETSPNPCRCPCYGCKHHCSAHNPDEIAAPAPAERRDRYAEVTAADRAEASRLALSEALGLGTSTPWAAVRERAVELRAVLEQQHTSLRADALREAAAYVRARSSDAVFDKASAVTALLAASEGLDRKAVEAHPVGVTAAELAHAIDNSTPYPIELDRPVVCTFMAERLLEMLTVSKRADHPVWRPEEQSEPSPCPQPQDPGAVLAVLPAPADETPATEETR